ncbi:MAG: hypothetical protein ACKO4S_06380 [Snowella sp.]
MPSFSRWVRWVEISQVLCQSLKSDRRDRLSLFHKMRSLQLFYF